MIFIIFSLNRVNGSKCLSYNMSHFEKNREGMSEIGFPLPFLFNDRVLIVSNIVSRKI